MDILYCTMNPAVMKMRVMFYLFILSTTIESEPDPQHLFLYSKLGWLLSEETNTNSIQVFKNISNKSCFYTKKISYSVKKNLSFVK